MSPADPMLHLGGSVARFTWEWREDSSNVWVLTVAEDDGSDVRGAVILELDDGQQLAGEVASTDAGTTVTWRADAQSTVTAPRNYIGASIVNYVTLDDGSAYRDVWARGILYTV